MRVDVEGGFGFPVRMLYDLPVREFVQARAEG